MTRAELLEAYAAGRISRRAFVRGSVALEAVAAPAARAAIPTGRRRQNEREGQGRTRGGQMTADTKRTPSEAPRAAQRVTERDLQQAVSDCARRLGWLAYHTHDARRTTPGFPDLVLVRDGRLIFAELKAGRGRISTEQGRWLAALERSGVEVHVWRPDAWFDGAIEEVLA